VVSWSDYDVN